MKKCEKCYRDTKTLTRRRCQICYRAYKKSDNYVAAFKTAPEKLTDFQLEVLDGLMLGDGCLFQGKNSKNPTLKIDRAIIDKEYLLWTYDIFKDFCEHAPKTYDRKRKDGSIRSIIINLETKSCKAFSEQYKRWYPNGKKIVPKDLKLTPLIIAIWLADDGTIGGSSDKNHRLRIKISSCGFTKSDNLFLTKLLHKRYNEYFSLTGSFRKNYNKTYYSIAAADKASRAIIKDIELSFPISMERKMYWKNPLSRYYENIPILKEKQNIIRKNKLLKVIKLFKRLKNL